MQGLPPRRTQRDWYVSMASNPFGRMTAGEDPSDGGLLVDRIDNVFFSTEQTSEIADALQRMLLNGLIDRHPAIDQSRRAGIEFMLRREETRILERFPWSTTVSRGCVIQGITKQAKTRTLNRFLSEFPQVLERAAAPGFGMESFQQLIYLVIPMPTDGTKSGFVLAAFLEIDNVLKTDYAIRYGKSGTLETQLVHLVNLLVIHKCGLLIVEETQEGHSISQKKFGRDFTLFFMRVMNFGIPLVAVGNPLAFEDVAMHAQTWERMTSCGLFTMEPAIDWYDPNWVSIIEQLTAMTTLPESDARIRGRTELYWREAGGYVKHAVEIRRHELLLAHDNGARRVERRHVMAAIELARRNRDMTLVDALRLRDFDAIKQKRDIPQQYFVDKWTNLGPLPEASKRLARR